MAQEKERVVIVGGTSNQNIYTGNMVSTTKYTVVTFLPKNLFEQFHRMANIYFLFIVILNWVPAINSFDKEIAILPLILVLSTTALKDLYEDRQRHLSDRRVNNLFSQVFSPAQGIFLAKRWQEVRVGDLVRLEAGDLVPADLLLLHTSDSEGKCNVETQNLDGETNLKPKFAVPGVSLSSGPFPPNGFHCVLNCEAPTSKIDSFRGTLRLDNDQLVTVNIENLLLRGCVLKITNSAIGLVVFAGHETKAMLNSLGPRYKRSKMEARINKDLLWCWVFLFVLCSTGAIGAGVWNASFSTPAPFLAVLAISDIDPAMEGFLTFWTFVIILQIIIPISLYITIEMVKVAQVYLIHSDLLMQDNEKEEGVRCKSFNITEDLGQVEHVLCDKTGTLTENKMSFKSCFVLGRDFKHDTDGIGGVQPS